MDWTNSKAIECFHVAFLAALRSKVPPERYVLKGGANLRYFFGSPRYSEDIDLDIAAQVSPSLERQVDAALRIVEPIIRSTGLRVDLQAVRKPAISAPGGHRAEGACACASQPNAGS